MSEQRVTCTDAGYLAMEAKNRQLESSLAESVAALKGMAMTCGGCWGNGYYYADQSTYKTECKQCKNARAIIAKHSG